MKYFFYTLILIACLTVNVSGQNVSINNDGAAPDNSAMLDVTSTTQGFLPPRLTSTQMDNINDPAEGLLIYNTDSAAYFYFNNIEWVSVGSYSLAAGDLYTKNGNIGIGTENPRFKLEVAGSEGKQISTLNIGTNNTIDDLPISDTANVIRLVGANNPVEITGIEASLDGRIIHLINSTGEDLKFKHDDNGSNVNNRFQLRDNGDKNCKPLQVSSFIYSLSDGGWVLMSEH